MREETDSGLLSLEDQQYLSHATKEQKRTEKGEIDRTRIQEEIYHGLLDFTLIDSELKKEHRREIFGRLPEDRDLQCGIEATLTFLLRGIEENTEQNAEKYLQSAAQRSNEKILDEQIHHSSDGIVNQEEAINLLRERENQQSNE